jgi:hypothetical protein
VMASDEFKRDYDEFLESVRGESWVSTSRT